MARSLKKGPFIDEHLMNKVVKLNESFLIVVNVITSSVISNDSYEYFLLSKYNSFLSSSISTLNFLTIFIYFTPY